MAITKQLVFRTIKEYLIITFGLVLYAFAWVAIVMPAKGVGGGASGIAMLIYYATGGPGGGLPVGVGFFVVNAVLLTIAAFTVGIKFGAKTIYAIGAISFFMTLLQEVLPPGMLGLQDDKLLSSILGGLAAGIGIAVVFTQGGSTGGTDIVAMIINKYRNISYGRILIICDFIIIGASLFVFKNITAVIYGFVMVGVFGYTVDYVLAGNRQSSQIFVISKNWEEIARRISEEGRRGVTLLDGSGWYMKRETKVVMVVCRKSETSLMFRLVRECDPQAFITVAAVMGVYGKGFDALKK